MIRAGRFGVRTIVEETDFHLSTPVQTGPASCTGTGDRSQDKATEAWRSPPTPSSAEVKNEKRYTYTPTNVCKACYGKTFAFSNSI